MSTPSIQTELSAQKTNNGTHALHLQEASLLQRPAIIELLLANKLPVHDLTEAVKLYGLYLEGELAGSAGLEIWGDKALLRSVCVADRAKGKGLGKYINQQIENLARSAGIGALYLVTTTAEGFFEKEGYRKIAREEVPQTVRQSGQFNGICPSSAAVMMKKL